ncbi:MAG: YidC/Oxa1 family membrane protein insertase [Oscillospiraceae bacterium]|jgi:YidC/Oxa1 family membrane protein insertase|nr:YidC/Oxa1 family membrane protein insertase [Oscillospiraceae bacterium]
MQNFYNGIYDIFGTVFGPIMRVIYEIVGNYGVAIILFTVFCRLLMLPTAISQQKNMAKNQRMQFKLRKIQERYKDDKQRAQQETQEFYRREGYNPLSAGCSGSMLLQFPIMFGLISAIYRPLKYALQVDSTSLKILTEAAPKLLKTAQDKNTAVAGTYIQLNIAENIDKFQGLVGTGEGQIGQGVFDTIKEFAANFQLFGLDLGAKPGERGGLYILIPILAGLASMTSSVFTFLRSRKQNPEQAKNPMMGCMTFGMPLFSVFLAFQFPVGIGMYWTISSLFAFAQMLVLSFTHRPAKMLARILVEETIQRRSRENSRKQLMKLG